ncbi:SDR family oxidoreductase [Glycomyces sp. NPDC048151]|uniref:SDR family oxidoreductase n=1 Tax=Glycomyces sp. NPDC048151 TaxID=3364002 RepID=UPI003714A98C
MIVVTGATGNVGRPLVELLLAEGEKVTAVSRSAAAFPEGVAHVQADLNDPETLRPAFDGADRLFLLTRESDHDLAPVLAAAKDAGIRRVVLLSSQRAETRDDPSQLVYENAVKASGLEWTFVRPGAFHSNAFMWAEPVRTARAIAAPFGDVGLRLIDPADIAAVAAVALTEDGHAGRAYTITGPAAVTPREQAAAIAAAIGETVQFMELTRDDAFAMFTQVWSPEIAEGALDALGSPNAAELADNREVERLTGRPATSFADWAQRNATAFK